MAVLSNVPPRTTSMLATLSRLLLVSSAITTAFTATTTIMLSFECRDSENSGRASWVVAFIPIFLLDCASVQWIIGMLLWFVAAHAWQFAAILALWFGFLCVVTVGIAGWIAAGTHSLTFSGVR
ncbi:uncharacterized protein CTRU02_212520 [Colletotrichum truncatum]|uniref:Uncharacterized protein n=1 Tax=Colletotrichum truncatum TaxID=5467 RepID=A0ACC3YQW6_COLTU|nr:uncharacterized protein CTRU02_05667 [Colletotrichum truncatum]KAF6794110.1 hypothetical protein CTRU02_05667 [Colletotrichum truncatum]